MVWLVLTTEIEAASKLELRRSYTNELISTCSLRHCSMCSLCCPTPNRSLPDRSRQRSCQCGFVQSRTHATICLRVHFPVVDGESDVNNHKLLEAAIAEARKGINEGGLPIGSVLADRDGSIVARGHNLRVQTGDPTAHAEVVCIRNAGRRRDWAELTLVSTLSPCIMCTGTSLLYRIPRVVIGENQNFMGAEELFRQHGVAVTMIQDPDCIRMMREFIRDHADLWN